MAGTIKKNLTRAKRAITGAKAPTPAEAIKRCSIDIRKLESREKIERRDYKRLMAEYESLEGRGMTREADALLDKIVSKEGLIKSLSQQIVARNNYVNKLEKCESLAEFAKMNDEFLGLVKGLEMQGVSPEEIESNAIEMQSAMDKLSDITETVESSMEAAYVDEVSNNQRKEAIRAETRAKIRAEKGAIPKDISQDL
jgi:hypothetical protein